MTALLAFLLLMLVPASADASSGPALRAVSSPIGTVVGGAAGRTVYVFDLDHRGTRRSACTGACRRAWPLMTFRGTARTHISLTGVTGRVSSIPARPGVRQVTLDGWPLYYYVGDSRPGQVNGQGSGGTWWAVGPSGRRVTQAASTPAW